MAIEPDYAPVSSDVIIKGTLRKARTWNKRFFVLREGPPPRLEYYENEKKWKSNKPKRCIDLGSPWNICERKGAKHDFLIVIFTEDEYFTMAAESAEVQQQWVDALQKTAKPEPGLALYRYVWHVTLVNKELNLTNSNLLMHLHGPHRICLTHNSMVFVHVNSSGGWDTSRGDPIEIPISSIRGCGHKETLFFIVPGRGSGIGSGGKLWMDLGDEAMTSQMHHTIVSNVFCAAKQEEALNHRHGSHSWGSNSDQVRLTRSCLNKPPPKHIGMGKAPGTSSRKGIRCDSLPGTHVARLHDSRLRTGSEWENTMKRPTRLNRFRSPCGWLRRFRRFRNSYLKRPHAHVARMRPKRPCLPPKKLVKTFRWCFISISTVRKQT